MRIVCGTDFSIHANTAALIAASLASRLAIPLSIVHVLDMSGYRDTSPDFARHLRSASEKKLQRLGERAAQYGATVETFVVEGSPAVKLSEFAATADARLLVISAAGQIAPTQWLAGSVADEVIQISAVPTLIIREPRSIEAWLDGKQSHNIMAAFDFSASSEAAIRWIASQQTIAPCAITVAYAASSTNERTRLGIAVPRSPLYYPHSLKQTLEEEIRSSVANVLLTPPHILVKTDWGRTSSQVIEMGRDLRADLLVVGTSERRGLARLGSVARAVTHYWETNVAVIPRGWNAVAVESVDRIAAINHPNEYAVAA